MISFLGSSPCCGVASKLVTCICLLCIENTGSKIYGIFCIRALFSIMLNGGFAQTVVIESVFVSLIKSPLCCSSQVTQTMQIPLSYAEDIIGVGGTNIAFIRRNSGAILTIQESRGLPDEITVEIKGTSSQVQMAQQLIQVILNVPFWLITSG